MAILEQHFYHETIQLYCGIFGSVFDEIQVKRKNNKLIKVPIAYAVKQKYDVRNTQNEDPNKARIKMQLPRMSFSLVNFRRDNNRVTNRMQRLIQNVDRKAAESVNVQYNRVPYNFDFRLNIKTKTIEDMLQIIEQILVYFNPSIVVNVTDNPDLNFTSKIPINLLSNDAFGDLFEGSFEDEQIIETSLDFGLEGHLYMPTNTGKVIKYVDINYFDLSTKEFLESERYTEADL